MKIKDLVLQTKNKDYDQVLEYIEKIVKKNGRSSQIVTINSEIIMFAKDDFRYEKVLKSSDLIVPDGIGVLWAGKMYGHRLDSRVHGVDLVEKVAKLSEKTNITIGLLGGEQNIALETSKRLQKSYPKARIIFAEEEWSLVKAPKKCDVLFVAFGSPKQEKWIHANLPSINVKLAVGVGGAFDFLSGRVRRAPTWVQNLGLEWLFRLFSQPWRIKRQLVIPKFMWLVLRDKLGIA